jgi:energy-coupling factor transporter ATP-binding protein EcfA2
VGPFRNAINIGSVEKYFDISVGSAFVKEWRRIKSGITKKNNERAIEVTDSIRRIFGMATLEINASEDDSTLQVIINNKSFRLGEVGSGITQFIVVLATVAIFEPRYVFIDEPELSLHPSLQLEFLTALESLSHDGVVFATHNIGLARTAEQVYSVLTKSQWESTIHHFESTPRLSELLGEMSFLGYKDLGYKKVLLVEGSTELRTFAVLLSLFKKEHLVVVLSMNGTNLINGSDDTQRQLEEIRRISNSVAAVIDSERTREGQALNSDRQGFALKCKAAGIECCVLARRAVEHYLSDDAIKKVKGPKYRALEPFEERSSVSPVWGKHENWRIAREMTEDEVADTDLGAFLKKL